LELARLGALAAQHRQAGHDSREGILRLVEAHGAPVLVEQLAEVTGLHHNTVRSHLDVLMTEGRVNRTRVRTGGRGRPPWQYEAVTAGRLSDVGRELAALLGQPGAEGSAADVVAAWASVADRDEPAASPDEAVALCDDYAPEHLELSLADPYQWIDQIRHAGAIFLGAYTSESLGDYCAGPNHVLPTMRSARFSSPLGTYDFQKRTSIVHISQAGAQHLGKVASILAHGEGLQAHARSAEMRLKV